MRTKAQAYKAAKKTLERLDNKNWQIIIHQNAWQLYDYSLSFHKGLLTLQRTENGEFYCMFTFDDKCPGTGDPRFSSNARSTDPNVVVEDVLRQVQTVVDKEVYELDVVRELMASPKRRQPW